MKTDIYTKIVLTIIAACLVSLAFREVSIIPNAQATEPLARGLIDVNIVQIDGKPFGKYDVMKEFVALPVKVK